MSATEALRTQLDALQVEHSAVLAENRKLRDARPELASRADLESELAEAQAENVRLSQTVTQLETTLREKEAEMEECAATLSHSAEALGGEAAGLREQLQRMEERLGQTQQALESATARAEEAESYVRRAESDCERAQREAELQTFRAVASETRKWEEREARLVKRIEELERGMVTVSPVVGCSEGDQRQQQASGEATREGETAVREELGSPRYAVSIQAGGSEPGRGEHKRGGDYSHPGSLTSERPRTDVPFPAETAVLSARGADYSHPGSLTSERPRTDGPFPAETAVLPARPSHPVPPHSSDLLHPTSPHPASLRANAPAFYPGLPTTQRKQMEGQGGATLTQQTEESSGCGAAVEPVSTLVATPFDTLSMALLAQQLPSLPCFSGEQMDGDGENFSEWLERLELVANTSGGTTRQSW